MGLRSSLLLLLVVAQRRRIVRQKLEAKALLEQANAQLESKVARRTKALTDTNARLRKEVTERQQAEQQQATEQLLRRVPDDPGALLRRKFEMEYRRRLAEGEDQ